MGGTCSTHGRYEKRIKILVGKIEGKSPLGRPKRKWNSIKMYIKEMGWKGVDWEQRKDRGK
jgi:hypothetical protein